MRNPPATRPFYAPTADWPLVDRPKFRAWAGRATGVSSTLGFFRLVPTIAAWMKQIASHFGGTRQGLAISWPGHIDDVGGIRTQFHHIIDIVPTILEATGIVAPKMVMPGIRDRLPVRIEGARPVVLAVATAARGEFRCSTITLRGKIATRRR